MHITLVHNPLAGNADLGAAQLVRILTKAGHSVTYVSSREKYLGRALQAATDMVVAAGGDGTVTKVVTRLNPGCPVAILPTGGANNIAKSLGAFRSLGELISSWPAGLERPFHLLAAQGPWGKCRIVEGLGSGALLHAIESMKGQKPTAISVRKVIRHVLQEMIPDEFQIYFDAESITGRFLILDVMNIPLAGPNLLLAPNANPSDQTFEICGLEPGDDERRRFSEWLTDSERYDAPAPISVRGVQRLTIVGRFHKVRLNDDIWTDEEGAARDREISVKAETQPIHFLVPGN